MVKRHIKRLVAPKSWPISRKGSKFVTRPNPGAHPLERAMSINLLTKELLNYAKKTREVKKILNAGNILVDNTARKDYAFAVGLMDVISIPETDEFFRLVLNKKGKLVLQPLKKEESNIKPCKIIGKTILKKKKIQLNLFDGKNIITEEDNYKVGDTVLYDLRDKKIKGLLKFERGALIYLYDGKYVGTIATLQDIKAFYGSQPSIIKLKPKDGNEFETLKEYAFVINDKVIKEQ